MGTKSGGIASGVDFNVLPEPCIANVLSLTSPRDACRLSLVSPIFRSAAESDVVWERFFPSHYRSIIARSDDSSPVVTDSKKKLYFCLCHNPFLIDCGRKSFSLDKWSGKKCFVMAARDISLTWSDTPDSWVWISLSRSRSRFAEVAELIFVWWLKICGKINTSMLSRETTYAAYLVCKFRNAYGLDKSPADVSVRIIGGARCTQTAYLDPDAVQIPGERDGQYPKLRGDGWFEIELGEYFNEFEGGEDEELEMRLMEVKSVSWKRGLIIQGIEIRPKEDDK